MAIKVGTTVRIERDEQKYPSKGNWPRYRGKVGTVVQINRRDNEIGVTFDPITHSPQEGGYPTSWFKPWELVESIGSPPRGPRSDANRPGGS